MHVLINWILNSECPYCSLVIACSHRRHRQDKTCLVLSMSVVWTQLATRQNSLVLSPIVFTLPTRPRWDSLVLSVSAAWPSCNVPSCGVVLGLMALLLVLSVMCLVVVLFLVLWLSSWSCHSCLAVGLCIFLLLPTLKLTNETPSKNSYDVVKQTTWNLWY